MRLPLSDNAVDWLDSILNTVLSVLVLASVALVIGDPSKIGFSEQRRTSVSEALAAVSSAQDCVTHYQRYAFFAACGDAGQSAIAVCPSKLPDSVAVAPATMFTARAQAEAQLAQMAVLGCAAPEEIERQIESGSRAFERVNELRNAAAGGPAEFESLYDVWNRDDGSEEAGKAAE